jgi:hypothetical protein
MGVVTHFVNPYHKPPPAGFVCVREGLAGRRADGKKWDQRSAFQRMEIEANEFSVALMVPTPEFRKSQERLSGSDLRHIGTLANLFATSKEVMSRIYVDTSPENIGIITSVNGQLRSFILPPSFPYLGLGKGRPLPSRSLSERFLKAASPGDVSGLLPVPSDVWLDRSPRNVELFEQAIAQRDGFGMTLLCIEQPDYEEADEQEEVERRWSAPRFAYGR